MGAASRVVAGCAINLTVGVGVLRYTKSWPTLGPIAEYLDRGTPKMPARPFMGYREIDLERIRTLLRQHVIPQGVWGTVRGWFGR